MFPPAHPLAMLRQFWEFGHPEKFKKVCAGAFDPLLRNHAPSAAFHVMASISTHTYNRLPQLGLLVKLSDSSYNQNDPEKARRLLTEAGYQGEPIRYMVHTDTTPLYRLNLATKQQLEAVGFTI